MRGRSVSYGQLLRDEELRVAPERRRPDVPLREPDREVERPLELRVVDRPLEERDVDRPLVELRLVERDAVLVRRRVLRRLRVVVARCDLGTSALTTSFTSRASSASRNLAIRSSSRLIDFASCAVSLSPTASAKVWIRE